MSAAEQLQCRCGHIGDDVHATAAHGPLCVGCFFKLPNEPHLTLVSNDEVQVLPTGTSTQSAVPSSSSLSLSHQDGEPMVEWLLREHKAGRCQPVEVALPPLPATARDSTRTVLEHFRLVYGLRLSVEDDRPVPLSARFVGKHTGLHHAVTNLALNRLCDHYGVLRRCEPLPGRNARGTHTYLPGGAA
jgi:hypothetical protein